MKKNIFFIGILVVIFGLIVGLPFAFTDWNKTLMDTQVPLIFYVISKVIFGLAFIGFGIWAVIKERARGMIYILMVATLFVQLVPLFVRFSTYFKAPGQTIYCIIMLAIFLIGYIAALGLVITSNKKQIVADAKYEGSTIEVKDEKVSENRHKGE
jgi:hypothetical protein